MHKALSELVKIRSDHLRMKKGHSRTTLQSTAAVSEVSKVSKPVQQQSQQQVLESILKFEREDKSKVENK